MQLCLTVYLPQLLSLLLPLYNLCLNSRRHLRIFKHFITVMLQKLNKEDYQQFKIY